MQEKGELKQNPHLKVIAFDINKTLIIKNKEAISKFEAEGKVNGEYIYLRPYLQLINLFIEEHRKDIKVVVWTTMQGTKRANSYLKLFREYNIAIDDIFWEKHCTADKQKDLRVIG